MRIESECDLIPIHILELYGGLVVIVMHVPCNPSNGKPIIFFYTQNHTKLVIKLSELCGDVKGEPLGINLIIFRINLVLIHQQMESF